MTATPRRPAAIAPAALSPADAAAYLSLAVSTFYAQVAREIPSARVGRRVIYRVVDLDAWLARAVAPAQPAYVPSAYERIRPRGSSRGIPPGASDVLARLLRPPRGSERKPST
jgi:excisionase family DNA binding protein